MFGERLKFQEWLESKGLSKRTIKEYLYYYDSFGGKDNFNQDFIDSFVGDFKHGGVVRAFVKNYRDFLLKGDPDNLTLMKVSIVKRTGKKPQKLPEYVTEDEVLQIEKSMRQERDKLLLLITFYCGLRAQGALNIAAISFDWKGWHKDISKSAKLKVTEKGQKERIVFVPSDLMRRLEAWIRVFRIQYPIARPLWNIKYTRWFYILSQAGMLALQRHVRPHMLRHGCAMWLLSRGWDREDIREYLGHQNLETTIIYTRANIEKLHTRYTDLFNN